MKRATLLTISLLIGLAGCSSTLTGDFCDVVKSPITFERETAAQIVKTDRAAAEAINVQNRYGLLKCKQWVEK